MTYSCVTNWNLSISNSGFSSSSYFCSKDIVEAREIGKFEKMAEGMKTCVFLKVFWVSSIGPLKFSTFKINPFVED